MKRMSWTILVLLLAAAVFLAGCPSQPSMFEGDPDHPCVRASY